MIGSPFYALAKCVTPGHYSDSIDVITLVTYGVIKPRNVHITLSTSGQYLGTFALTTCQIRGKNTPPPTPPFWWSALLVSLPHKSGAAP